MLRMRGGTSPSIAEKSFVSCFDKDLHYCFTDAVYDGMMFQARTKHIWSGGFLWKSPTFIANGSYEAFHYPPSGSWVMNYMSPSRENFQNSLNYPLNLPLTH